MAGLLRFGEHAVDFIQSRGGPFQLKRGERSRERWEQENSLGRLYCARPVFVTKVTLLLRIGDKSREIMTLG